MLSGSDVDINIDGLGAVSGGFAVEKIGQNLLVGITNSAADFGGVALSSGTLGLFVSQNSAGADGYALVGSASASLAGLDGMNLSAIANIRVNTLRESVNQTIAVDGVDVPIFFDTAADVRDLQINNGTLTIDGLGSISGALAIKSETVIVGATETSTLVIGLANLNGNLTPGGVGAVFSAGAGAVFVERITVDGVITSNGYALDLGGNVELSGVSGVTLEAENLNVRYNRLSRAVDNMIISAGEQDYVLNLLDNESRLSGEISADIAGMINLNGQMFIESRVGLGKGYKLGQQNALQCPSLCKCFHNTGADAGFSRNLRIRSGKAVRHERQNTLACCAPALWNIRSNTKCLSWRFRIKRA